MQTGGGEFDTPEIQVLNSGKIDALYETVKSRVDTVRMKNDLEVSSFILLTSITQTILAIVVT